MPVHVGSCSDCLLTVAGEMVMALAEAINVPDCVVDEAA